MASKSLPAEATPTSSFYQACRNGSIDVVRQLLPEMSLEEIDKIESNGSTALHAACYYNHTEIVKLLLERGASRSIENIYKCVPYDEAKRTEIKHLFIRSSMNRYASDESGHIYWIKCDEQAEELAKDYRFRHAGFGWTSKNIERRMQHIRNEMSGTDQERIRIFLDQAQNNPKMLLKAYTVESNFYVNLNKDLATKHFDQGTNFGLTYFIDFFYNHPDFDSLSYKGKVYRGMTITQDDLSEYNVGNKIMNKAFMSTTTNRSVAKNFAEKTASNRKYQHGDYVKLSALCSYEIVNPRTGLDLKKLSEYQHEEEVLVGPYTAFSITAVRHSKPNYVEIDLHECKAAKIETTTNDDDDDDD